MSSYNMSANTHPILFISCARNTDLIRRLLQLNYDEILRGMCIPIFETVKIQ